MKMIGIAGGSGAGKSTVAYRLVDTDPDGFEVINLDDYQKLKTEPDLPMVGSMINWDHPDIIRWDDLRRDIEILRSGKPVRIPVWAHRSNPGYAVHGEMKPRIINPRPILIVEGYLALYQKILAMYDRTFYLDLDDSSRAERRRKARGGKDTIIGESDYVEKVLMPMHALFVEPTKTQANIVIQVKGKSAKELAQLIQLGIN